MTLFRSSRANRGSGGAWPERAQRARAGAAARASPPLSPSSRNLRRGMSSTKKGRSVMGLPPDFTSWAGPTPGPSWPSIDSAPEEVKARGGKARGSSRRRLTRPGILATLGPGLPEGGIRHGDDAPDKGHAPGLSRQARRTEARRPRLPLLPAHRRALHHHQRPAHEQFSFQGGRRLAARRLSPRRRRRRPGRVPAFAGPRPEVRPGTGHPQPGLLRRLRGFSSTGP